MADGSDKQLDDAARVIQKTFRGYRARREFDGFSIDAGSRWMSAVREAQFRQTTKPINKSAPGSGSTTGLASEPTAKQHWKKASTIAIRAGRDESDTESDDDLSDIDESSGQNVATKREAKQKAKAERKQAARQMGLQYFLEMIDTKHRYGSNLRIYHEEWKRSHSNDNFFDWLDKGDGSRIELDMCPRDRLEREQVRYLSREERQFYLVNIDAKGRLCWAKNNARIDTTEQFKDSIHGIVPSNDPTPAFNAAAMVDDDESGHDSDSSSSLESKREADRAAKYATPDFDDAPGLKKVNHVTASTVFNKMLRKSVRKNTWIFVADTSFRLYVGIKESGSFQHSSFLQGGRISAAGLIKIKNGRLKSLSPLSGHYRPPSSNFKSFLKALKAENVDMSSMTISKSYAVLLGLETYVGAREKTKSLVGKLVHSKDKVVKPNEMKRREEEAKDKSQSAAKEREILARETEKRLAQKPDSAIVKATQNMVI